MSQRVLFSGMSVFDVMHAQKQRLRTAFREFQTHAVDSPDVAERLAKQYALDIPTLDDSAKYAKTRETQIDVRHHPGRFVLDRSRPVYVPGTEVRIFVPFAGDPAAFDIRPSAFDSNPPVGDVIGSELCLLYNILDATTQLTSQHERTITAVKRYLDWLRPAAAQLYVELRQMGEQLVSERNRRTAEHAQVLDSLGIPIRHDSQPRGAPPPHVVETIHRAPQKRGAWDVFISHASEDKDEIARPLANALDERSFAVWYDEFSLRVGDSLRESIDRGLSRSKFGVVILSPHFFEKHWPQQELNGLATRELGHKKVILPIWHRVDFEQVRQYSPSLADRIAVNTAEGLEKVIEKIVEAMW